MGQATYVLKAGKDYLKVPYKGSASICTTGDILECIHFISPDHAKGFLHSIFNLPETVLIESDINFRDVNIVKAVLNITEEPVNV